MTFNKVFILCSYTNAWADIRKSEGLLNETEMWDGFSSEVYSSNANNSYFFVTLLVNTLFIKLYPS